MSQSDFSGRTSNSLDTDEDDNYFENMTSYCDDKTHTSCDQPHSKSVCVVSNSSISTPVSILIESLIKNICMIYETDREKANAMYKIICDKLYSMKLLDESYSMMEFEGIRSQYQRGFLQLLASVKNGDKSLPLTPIWPKTDINSHYQSEFNEVEYIAGGGFGQVYRVKHKLDGTEYAIKKIPIRSEGIQSVRNYLSEVKTFASMNHSNIVQYKGAWLEIGEPSTKNSCHISQKQKHVNGMSDIENHTKYIYHKDITQSFTKEKNEESTDFLIDFEHSVSGAGYVKSKSCSKRRKRKSVSEGSDAAEGSKLSLKEIEQIKNVHKTRVKWATLYIQMELCQSTLKQWLEKRNSFKDPDRAIVSVNENAIKMDAVNKILIQLLEGLEYIHYKGIVHHDIKPSNIFIRCEKDNILIQLGDFGLACPLQNVRHSLAFGTKLYAAPEQLAGKCNLKSDIYSLGIVLFELVQNFNTDMERVEYITELRKGNLPPSVHLKYPDTAQMIENLIVKNPEDRPDTRTLLSALKKSDSKEIEDLKMLLIEKEEEILHLKELLKSYGMKSV